MAGELAVVGQSSPDVVLLNMARWTELEKELLSRGIRYVDVKTDIAGIGYSGIQLKGPRGDMKVLGSPFCPYQRGYVLQMDTWELVSAGEMPMLFDEDGLSILRAASANQYEARFGWYGQLVCKAPGNDIAAGIEEPRHDAPRTARR